MRSVFVNVPVFSPQSAAGRTTSASRAVSVRNASETTRKSSSPREDRADPAKLGQRDRRVRAAHPEELDRALLGVAEDLHRVRRRAPVRDLQRLDVPERGELRDVGLVLPVAEAGQVAVAARLAGVLRRRLPVHLQDPRARPADHPAQQVDVVRRARGGGRLMRLVDALEDERQQALGLAEDLGRPADVVGRDAADLGDALRRVARRRSSRARRTRPCARRGTRGRAGRSRSAAARAR